MTIVSMCICIFGGNIRTVFCYPFVCRILQRSFILLYFRTYGRNDFFFIHIYYYYIIIIIIIFKTLPIIIILITYLSRSVSLISWQYFMIKITQLSVTNNTDFFLKIIIVGVSRSIIQTSRSLGLPLLCPLSKLCKNFFLCPMAVRIQNKMASIFI